MITLREFAGAAAQLVLINTIGCVTAPSNDGSSSTSEGDGDTHSDAMTSTDNPTDSDTSDSNTVETSSTPGDDLSTSDESKTPTQSEDSSQEDTSVENSTSDEESTVLLIDYEPQGEPFFVVGSGSDNLSGLTYHPGRDLYFGVIDTDGPIYEINGQVTEVVRTIERQGDLNDFEGIAYLEGDFFALVSESNKMAIVEIGPATTMVDTSVTELTFHQPTEANTGAEGVAFDATSGNHGRFWVAIEKTPKKILTFERPGDLQSHDIDDLAVNEPFDAQALEITDLADLAYDPQTGHLLICGQEDGMLIEVDPQSGEVIASLRLTTSFGDAMAKWEAVTLGRDREIVVVSEGLGAMYNWAQRWVPSP